MITNVTATTNYNNYNLGFKGVKDKFKSVADKISTKIMTPQEIMNPEKTERLAQLASSRRQAINTGEIAYLLAPNISNMPTKLAIGRKDLKTQLELLTVPDRLRRLLNHYGYGEKLNELRAKLTFADDKESVIIKQEIRNLIDECASKNPPFKKVITSLEKIEWKGSPEFGIGSSKVDVIDDFILWE